MGQPLVSASGRPATVKAHPRQPCQPLIPSPHPCTTPNTCHQVERLQRRVRDPRAGYFQSLDVLRAAKECGVYTKSSLMLGLGELGLLELFVPLGSSA